jgi:hypothetical protein
MTAIAAAAAFVALPPAMDEFSLHDTSMPTGHLPQPAVHGHGDTYYIQRPSVTSMWYRTDSSREVDELTQIMSRQLMRKLETFC